MYSNSYPWEYTPDPINPAVASLAYPSSDGLLFRTDDARLIAAAPDLLAALREMLCQFADHEQYDEDGYDTAAINNARAAIARATGEA